MLVINIKCIYFQKRIPPIIQIFVIIDDHTMVFLWSVFCIISIFIKTLNNTKLCFYHAHHLFVKFQFATLFYCPYPYGCTQPKPPSPREVASAQHETEGVYVTLPS